MAGRARAESAAARGWTRQQQHAAVGAVVRVAAAAYVYVRLTVSSLADSCDTTEGRGTGGERN